MKLTTLLLASALAMSGSFAFAQAGEGDLNYEGHWSLRGGYWDTGRITGTGADRHRMITRWRRTVMH